MKRLLSVVSVVLCLSQFASGQTCEIVGYDQNGSLTFSSANMGGLFTLEFSGTAGGPWTNWGSVSAQAITGSVMALPTPMFFRIAEKPSPTAGVVSNAALRLFLVTRGFDHNGDFRIDASEAGNVPYLVFWGGHNGLSDTAGSSSECGWGWQDLDCSPFTNAQSVFLRDLRQLTNVCLSGLATLENLSCQETPIQHIGLESLRSLQNLHCENNKLTSLDIATNTNLISVSATGNPLQEIVVWWNPTSPPPITLTYDGEPTIVNP